MSRRTNRVVFLDVDGVLAPCGRPMPALDAETVDRCRSLAKHACLVLSSSWMPEDARAYGVPVDDALDDDERRAPEADRLRGIARYLDEHPFVTQWVSIDDDRQVAVLRRMPETDRARRLLSTPERFLQTDWSFLWPFERVDGAGLTADVYDQAVTLLRPELARAITEHAAAVRKWDATLAELAAKARGACCPTCFHGKVYVDTAVAAAACKTTLVQLLRKRGAQGDDDRARAVEADL